jgi:hypothetical protein
VTKVEVSGMEVEVMAAGTWDAVTLPTLGRPVRHVCSVLATIDLCPLGRTRPSAPSCD